MWPYPFTWVPAEGHRHASSDPVPPPGREFPPDISVTTLCDRQVTTATGEVAWFWPTCFDCDDRARALVGVAARTARTPERSAREERGTARNGAECSNPARNSAERSSAGRSGAERGGAGRSSAERRWAEQSSAEQGDGRQPDSGPHPANSHSPGSDHSPASSRRSGSAQHPENTAGGGA